MDVKGKNPADKATGWITCEASTHGCRRNAEVCYPHVCRRWTSSPPGGGRQGRGTTRVERRAGRSPGGTSRNVAGEVAKCVAPQYPVTLSTGSR